MFYDVEDNPPYIFIYSLITFNRDNYISTYSCSADKSTHFVTSARNKSIFNRSEYINIYSPPVKKVTFNVSVRDGDSI